MRDVAALLFTNISVMIILKNLECRRMLTERLYSYNLRARSGLVADFIR